MLLRRATILGYRRVNLEQNESTCKNVQIYTITLNGGSLGSWVDEERS